MVFIRDLYGRLLNSWMVLEIRADQFVVPGPVILRIRRRMNTNKPVARSDIFLEGLLLRGVEHVAGRIQKDDGLVLCKRCRVELCRYFGSIDQQVVFGAQLLQGQNCHWDGRVKVTGSFVKDQNSCGWLHLPSRFLLVGAAAEKQRKNQTQRRV
jgi:hypothetical protein